MGRIRQIALGLALPLALLAAGCGGSGGEGGRHPDYATALAGSPPPLAALHRQADQLLPGGIDAYEKRIAALHGYPVVVSVWTSWCGPCRHEFPTLQKLSARYGKRVAFLGVNSEDSESNATELLEEDPLSYPSYSDPDKSLGESFGVRGFPDLAVYNRDGELAYFRPGPFAKQSELGEAIEQCALQERCESG